MVTLSPCQVQLQVLIAGGGRVVGGGQAALYIFFTNIFLVVWGFIFMIVVFLRQTGLEFLMTDGVRDVVVEEAGPGRGVAGGGGGLLLRVLIAGG